MDHYLTKRLMDDNETFLKELGKEETMVNEPDPVEYINTPEITGWVFWDETWTFPSAAWGTEEEARTALREYVRVMGMD